MAYNLGGVGSQQFASDGGVALLGPPTGGTYKFGDGSAAAPSITFASATNYGVYYDTSTPGIGFAVNGTRMFTMASAGRFMGAQGSSQYLGMPSDGSVTLAAGGSSQNITLTPSGSGVVAIGPTTATTNLVRIGVVSDQTSRGLITFNNTFTDAGYMGISAFSSTLKFLAGTFDFNGTIALSGTTRITAPSDGVLRLTNAALSDFSRLQFGGTTASFPALKRSGTELQARLADDSGYADFRAAYFTGIGITVSSYLSGNTLRLTDGVTAPGTVAGIAQIYVDTADGDLKVIFGDGTVKTIVTDT